MGLSPLPYECQGCGHVTTFYAIAKQTDDGVTVEAAEREHTHCESCEEFVTFEYVEDELERVSN